MYVTVQINLGTRERCESRLALIMRNPEMSAPFGPGALWCSSESATAKLKYRGVFWNMTNGKSLDVESRFLELCTTAVEALTGGQAPNNKIEATTECQAR